MTSFLSAMWVESLKVRRSKVPLFTSFGFALLALVDGLFMIIMKDPEKARSMGLIGAKASFVAGAADWPTFWSVLKQGTAVAGMFIFAILTIWIFGREFSDHTVKDLLALPTTRSKIISAKFVMIILWGVSLTLCVYLISLLIGIAVVIPGWSSALAWKTLIDLLVIAGMNLALMTPVAILASAGRGYLPPLGWVILTVFLAQILAALGWGTWFPWSIPAIYSGEAGSYSDGIGIYSIWMIVITSFAGLGCTYSWWYLADHTR